MTYMNEVMCLLHVYIFNDWQSENTQRDNAGIALDVWAGAKLLPHVQI